MDRREFIGISVSAFGVALAGCVSDTGLHVYQEKTTVDVDGDMAVWTWVADIDAVGLPSGVNAEVTITLFDEDSREIATFTRVVKNIESSGLKYEVSYIASHEVINSIVDYDVSLQPLTTETPS